MKNRTQVTLAFMRSDNGGWILSWPDEMHAYTCTEDMLRCLPGIIARRIDDAQPSLQDLINRKAVG